MRQSDFLWHLMESTDKICAKCGINYRPIEALFVAMLLECQSTQFTLSKNTANSIECEKERMCHIIESFLKTDYIKAAEQAIDVLKENKDNLSGAKVTLEVLLKASQMARKQKQKIISADIVAVMLLLKQKTIFSEILFTVRMGRLMIIYKDSGKKTDFFKRHQPIRNEVIKDASIYKAEKAGDEDEIKQKFISAVRILSFRKQIKLTVPFYFPNSSLPLSLWLTQKGEQIYVTDMGRTFRELKRRLTSGKTALQMIRYFALVELEIELNMKKELIVPISDTKGFYKYLQVISRIANSDLYPYIDKNSFESHKNYGKKYILPKDGVAPNGFVTKLFEHIEVSYNEREGTLVQFPFYFDNETAPMQFNIKKAPNSMLAVTDFCDREGRQLFARMETLNDDIHFFDDNIKELCERFGAQYNAEFGEENIVVIFSDNYNTAIPQAVFKFMQLASILGEIGRVVVMH